MTRSDTTRTASGTMSKNVWYNKWQRVVQRVKTKDSGDKKCQRVVVSANLPFVFWIREELNHYALYKESFKSWGGPIKLRAEEILTVRRRN